MTAAPAKAKQKITSNFDRSNSESIDDVLTHGNIHLSKNGSLIPLFAIDCKFAVDCKNASEAPVAEYIRASVSDNTRSAYLSDLQQFQIWGGQIPASPEMVASYLASQADRLSVATLVRRLAAIAKAHSAKGLPSPTTTEVVKATVRGIKRTHGTSQRQSKSLFRENLFLTLDRMKDRPKDLRDRALLLVGFAGGFRRSELVGLDRADVETVREGLIVNLKCSKTDQEAAGRKIGIPYGRTRHCPVTALEAWLALSEITGGPLFRQVDRHGRIHPERLSGEAVSIIIRERLATAGIDPSGFSGHSLRAGFATSAAQAGVSTSKIRAQTGHASDAMLARYIRDGQLFVGNAAGVLL
jgi:integrase